MADKQWLKVVEFYSGIGGMHFAIKREKLTWTLDSYKILLLYQIAFLKSEIKGCPNGFNSCALHCLGPNCKIQFIYIFHLTPELGEFLVYFLQRFWFALPYHCCYGIK